MIYDIYDHGLFERRREIEKRFDMIGTYQINEYVLGVLHVSTFTTTPHNK
jgi:hypothetical protein